MSREAAPDRSPWVERSGTLGAEPCMEKPRTGRRKTNGMLLLCIRAMCGGHPWIPETKGRSIRGKRGQPPSLAPHVLAATGLHERESDASPPFSLKHSLTGTKPPAIARRVSSHASRTGRNDPTPAAERSGDTVSETSSRRGIFAALRHWKLPGQ